MKVTFEVAEDLEEDGNSIQGSAGCVSTVENIKPSFVEEETENENTANGLEDELHFVMPPIAEGYQLKKILQEDTDQESSIYNVKAIILFTGEVAGIKARKY